MSRPKPAARRRTAEPQRQNRGALRLEKVAVHETKRVERLSPEKAREALLRLLGSVPAWERFPADFHSWTPNQVEERNFPPDDWRMSGGGVGVSARENGNHAPIDAPPSAVPPAGLQVGCRVNGSDRFETISLEEHLRRAWYRANDRFGGSQRIEPRIEPNAWSQRVAAVRDVVAQLPQLVGPAIEFALACGGSAEPLRAIERDTYLHTDTVQAAIRELERKVHIPEGLRVTLQQAMDGVENIVPGLNLPRTPRSNLYLWLGDEKTAKTLGTDHRAARRAQRPLVAGLLSLQDAASKRDQPTKGRAKGTGGTNGATG